MLKKKKRIITKIWRNIGSDFISSQKKDHRWKDKDYRGGEDDADEEVGHHFQSNSLSPPKKLFFLSPEVGFQFFLLDSFIPLQ